MSKIEKIKRHWVEITLSVAFGIPILAVIIVKDWSVYSNALSDFGTDPRTAGFWSVYLLVTSVILWLNGNSKIEVSFTGRENHMLSLLLNMACIGLFLTGLITSTYRELHGIVAGTFFTSYVLFIFFYGFWKIKKNLKEGAVSVITAFILLLTSLLTLPVQGLALFEICYILVIILWNWVVRERSRVEFLSKLFTKKKEDE